MKAAFLTLGCKLNYAETSTYERGLLQAGFAVVPWRDKADVYLVNTCSVTATSDAKSRNLIRKVHRVNPDARIYVTGCSAQLRRSEIEAIPGVTRVFGCDEKHLVVPEILDKSGRGPGWQDFGSRKGKGPTEWEGSGQPGPRPDVPADAFAAYSTGERTRSFLKVQDGCDNWCAYCTVPMARGQSRNIPIEECVCMARKIAAEGVKEIVLTGVNTGDFGRSTGESFLDLLKALEQVDGIERYRISSIEPNLLTEEIIDWLSGSKKFQPHFHIPLQAGTDQILEAMGRHYNTEFFRQKIEYIRKAFQGPGKPEVFFGIDVMAGLPGETVELFEKGVEFIREIEPAFIHVFPYSRRPGTRADRMPGQVDEEEKKRRVAVLEELCAHLYANFVERHRGQTAEVLFESKEKGGKMSGFTGNYIKVTQDYDPQKVGKIVKTEI